MNEKNENVGEKDMPESTIPSLPPVRSPSRRRLIKLGAAGVPVVATLASSPAMAWSCRAPSAWGSNMTGNLTASQAANPGQKSYKDETWTVSNWGANTARSATGYSERPWAKLKAAYPNIYYGIPGSVPASDKFMYVTMATLVNNTGMTMPTGVNGSSLVVTLLKNGDTFTQCIITAQLNYLFPTTSNQMNTCVIVRGQNQLALMATGSYKPAGGGATWDKTKIVTYLRGNYMASA